MSYNSVSLYNNNGTVIQFDGNSGSSGPSTASEVTYDNTQSQLDATNVQSAIDELVVTRPMSVATLNITTTTPELFGQTITATGTKETYTTTFSQTGEATISIKYVGQYTLTCLGASNTVTITSIGATYTSTLDLEFATLDITCADTSLYGESLTVSFGGSEIGTVAIDNEGKGTYKVFNTGTYTLSYTGKPSKDVVVSALNTTVEVTYGIPMKTFAAATEEEIALMVAAADAGEIDLYSDCGWRVGQSRTVQLSAIASSGTYDGVSWSVGEDQSAQSIQLVLMHQGLYTLVNPVKNKGGSTRNTCSFVCGMKDCLNTLGYLNSTDTNTGSWPSCSRRNWCNGGFRQAMPETLRSCFKQFNTITGDYNGTSTGGSNLTSQDYFALPAYKEVEGVQESSTYLESVALTQFTWYQTSSNRNKSVGGQTSSWWERSPRNNNRYSYCFQGSGGTAYATTTRGLSPFGCL